MPDPHQHRQISYMVQQLSNVAFARYFAGSTRAGVVGRLERLVRTHFSGGGGWGRSDPAGLSEVDRVFALDFLLPGYQRGVVGPAVELVRQGEVVDAARSRRARTRPRPGRSVAAPGGTRNSPSLDQIRGAWERRMLAAVVAAFAAECERAGTSGLQSVPVHEQFLRHFRARWGHLLQGLPEGIAGIEGLVRTLQNQADQWLPTDAEGGDPGCGLEAGRNAMATFGLPISLPVRGALKWHTERKRLLAAFWSEGGSRKVEAPVEPWELYAAWIELRLNEATFRPVQPVPCEVLGRLRGEPADHFYNRNGDCRHLAAHTNGLFPPDARVVVLRVEERAIRRVWVQAEWERVADDASRLARLAWLVLQASNLDECHDLVLLTPWPEDWHPILPEGKWVDAGGRVGLRIRMLPFVPDPARELANQASVRAVFEGGRRP